MCIPQTFLAFDARKVGCRLLGRLHRYLHLSHHPHLQAIDVASLQRRYSIDLNLFHQAQIYGNYSDSLAQYHAQTSQTLTYLELALNRGDYWIMYSLSSLVSLMLEH